MQKHFELPKRGLSGFLRRATPAEAAAVLHQTLDEGLLKQLGPFAAVHPYSLEGKVKELHTLVVSPKPAPGGAESSGQVSMPSICGFMIPVPPAQSQWTIDIAAPDSWVPIQCILPKNSMLSADQAQPLLATLKVQNAEAQEKIVSSLAYCSALTCELPRWATCLKPAVLCREKTGC